MLALSLKCLVISLMLSSILGAVTPSSKPFYDLENAEFHFETFLKTYGKQYADDEEKNRRFEIFKENLEHANQMNSDPNQGAEFGITQFSDLTKEEFLKGYTGLKVPEKPIGPFFNLTKTVTVPAQFDWRDQGVVTGIKDQGDCGSCWAFSSTACIESVYAIKYKRPVVLSEQQMLDCDDRENGCSGGYMQNAVNYIVQTGGQEGEEAYPYEMVQNQCRFRPSYVQAKVAKVLVYNLNGEEVTLQYLVQNGPIAIALDSEELPQYKGGVISCRGTSKNHAVLLVGYGEEGGVPYYIIKNSWGAQWGESGYARLHRQHNCGIYNRNAAGAIIA